MGGDPKLWQMRKVPQAFKAGTQHGQSPEAGDSWAH